jgi:acyl-CoA synthetase (NDP forming)
MEEERANSMLVYFLATAAMIQRALASLGVPKEEIDGQAARIVDDQCASVAALIASHDKPVLGFSFLTRENPFISGLQDKGVPVLPSPERAARALGLWWNTDTSGKNLSDQNDDSLISFARFFHHLRIRVVIANTISSTKLNC